MQDEPGELPSGPGADPTSTESEPLASPPARPRRTAWIVALVIVVAAVVVVAALFASGVGPFARPSPSNGTVGSGPTFATALRTANGSASHYGSGPWHVFLAAGAAPNSPLLESTALPSNLLEQSGLTDCAGTDESPGTSAVSFDGYNGNYSTGDAPAWIFFMINGSGAVLFDAVIGSNSVPVELFQGSGCSTLTLLGTLPTGTVDSSVAARAALVAGGYGFISAHPGGSLVYSAQAILSSTARWSVTYSTCPADGRFSSSSTYYQFEANVSLTTGTLIGNPSSGTAACSSTGLDLTAGLNDLPGALSGGGGSTTTPGPALDTVLGITSQVVEAHGDFYNYEVNVTRAGSGLVMEDLLFALNESSGVAVGGFYGAIQLFSTTGCILAFGALNDPDYGLPLTGTTCSGPATGGSAAISVGEEFDFQSSLNLTGLSDVVEIYPSGSTYSGLLTETIP